MRAIVRLGGRRLPHLVFFNQSEDVYRVKFYEKWLRVRDRAIKEHFEGQIHDWLHVEQDNEEPANPDWANEPRPIPPPAPEGTYRDYRGDIQLNGTLPWPQNIQHLEYVDREGRVRDLYNINDYLDHPPRYFTTEEEGELQALPACQERLLPARGA